MLEYVLLCGTVGFLSIQYRNRINKRISFAITVVLMVLLAGLRGDFTPDYLNYRLYFDFFRGASFEQLIEATQQMEIGFVLLTKAISLFCTYQQYIFIISVLIVGLMAYAFYKNAKMPVLGLLLYLTFGSFYDSFNIMRQCLAVAILLSGSQLLYERKTIKYIILCLFASLFHSTAIIMIPLYFLLGLKIKRTYVIKMFVLAVCAWLAVPLLVKVLGIIIPRLAKIQMESYGMTAGTIGYFVAPMFCGIILLALVLCGSKTVIDFENYKRRIQLNALFFSFVVSLFTTRAFLLNRIMGFLIPYVFMLIGDCIYDCRSEKNRRIIHASIIVIAIIYTYISLHGTPYDPYYYYWNN